MRFTYKDIAILRGVTIYAVRKAVDRKLLDPTDLRSICKYIYKKGVEKQ